MPYLGMNQLGDHIRVGPQMVPAVTRGVPIISRGPHGARFAPLPGPGEQHVRWWSESLVPGSYTPQQRVTGVMGLGALGGEAPSSVKVDISNKAKELEARFNSGDRSSTLSARADDILRELGNFSPFGEDRPWQVGDWDDSQTIRSRMFRIQQGIIHGRVAPPVRGVATYRVPGFGTVVPFETAREYPGALMQRKAELERGQFWTPEQRQALDVIPGLPVGTLIERMGKKAAKEAERTRNWVIGVSLLAIGVAAYSYSRGRRS